MRSEKAKSSKKHPARPPQKATKSRGSKLKAKTKRSGQKVEKARKSAKSTAKTKSGPASKVPSSASVSPALRAGAEPSPRRNALGRGLSALMRSTLVDVDVSEQLAAASAPNVPVATVAVEQEVEQRVESEPTNVMEHAPTHLRASAPAVAQPGPVASAEVSDEPSLAAPLSSAVGQPGSEAPSAIADAPPATRLADQIERFRSIDDEFDDEDDEAEELELDAALGADLIDSATAHDSSRRQAPLDERGRRAEELAGEGTTAGTALKLLPIASLVANEAQPRRHFDNDEIA
ncbi:MAG: hypothetical protein KDD44_09905, partial [Bdellovibrionales bacterium]|nr:hypothetical protein [Bdellovibrionales bacterium]